MAKKKTEAETAAHGGNEIIVYQPNDVMRIDVRLDRNTVWLSQRQMAQLFGCSADNIGLHLKNIYADAELSESATAEDSSVVRQEGSRTVTRKVRLYNLDAIISVGFRVNSKLGIRFRQWANSVIQEHLLRGYSFNSRFNQLEDRMDRRLLAHDQRIEALESKVDFFVKTQTPPLQGVFYDGELWDAAAFVTGLIASAKKSIWLIDNWATVETLDMLAKKKSGVAVTVVTSEHVNKKTGLPDHQIKSTDIKKFNKQYPKLDVRFNENFHDRFLILDDKEIYLIGASLKDLGKKCFGFTKMDASEISGLKARV